MVQRVNKQNTALTLCYKKMQQQFYYEGWNFDQMGSFFLQNKLKFPFLSEGEEEEENENTQKKH